MDSSSLAALAAGVVGRQVWTRSLLLWREREDLVQHEMSYIGPLAQQYNFERRRSVFLHQRLILELWRAFPPLVFHVLHPALCSLPKLRTSFGLAHYRKLWAINLEKGDGSVFLTLLN